MLTNAIYTDFQSIYRFATIHQRKILDLYFRRYEIGLLKTCMRMVFDHRDVELNFDIFKDFFEKHSDINLTALSNCKTLDEFVSLLKGSIYYRPLSLLSGLSEPTLWDYEMALDLCYFKWFWDSRKKVLTRDEERIFMDDYGVKNGFAEHTLDLSFQAFLQHEQCGRLCTSDRYPIPSSDLSDQRDGRSCNYR